jgi:hypothetical protein
VDFFTPKQLRDLRRDGFTFEKSWVVVAVSLAATVEDFVVAVMRGWRWKEGRWYTVTANGRQYGAYPFSMMPETIRHPRPSVDDTIDGNATRMSRLGLAEGVKVNIEFDPSRGGIQWRGVVQPPRHVDLRGKRALVIERGGVAPDQPLLYSEWHGGMPDASIDCVCCMCVCVCLWIWIWIWSLSLCGICPWVLVGVDRTVPCCASLCAWTSVSSCALRAVKEAENVGSDCEAAPPKKSTPRKRQRRPAGGAGHDDD